MNAKRIDAEMSEKEKFAFKSIQWAVWGAVLIGLGFWVYVSIDSDEPTEFQKRAIQETVENHSRNLEEDWLFQEREWADASVDEARRALRLARTAQDIALAEDDLRTARAKLERIEEKLARLDE